MTIFPDEPAERTITYIELAEFGFLNQLKLAKPEIEFEEVSVDPGDPPGVTEVPTEWSF